MTILKGVGDSRGEHIFGFHAFCNCYVAISEPLLPRAFFAESQLYLIRSGSRYV